jgi:allantoicase
MIQDNDPVWKQDLYTSYGKWMDGWESRRRRTEGHDWCIVQLGQLTQLMNTVHSSIFHTCMYVL